MGEWISVKDRLPETEDLYLVIANGKPKKNITLVQAYELATYCPDEGWILEQYPEWETPEVTHWMLLPEQPKEEKHE